MSAACRSVMGQASAETSEAAAVKVSTSRAACCPREATTSMTLEPRSLQWWSSAHDWVALVSDWSVKRIKNKTRT